MARGDTAARLARHKAVALRGAGFALAAAAVCGALVLGSALRAPARAPAPIVATATAPAPDSKSQARMGERRPAAAAGPEVPPPHGMLPAAHISVWHPGRMEDAPATLSASISPSAEEVALREETFALVTVIDGRTLAANGLTLRLAGLELPPADQVCRTLDGRLEPCVTRAATQLELLTRSRALACRYRMTTSSEGEGACRIGSQDLAERLVRAGYVRAAASARTMVANAGEGLR